MFKDYYEVRDWLESFIPQTYSRKNLGLERIKFLLKLLDNPQNKFKSILVGGTSGKGSTAYYIARLLQCAGAAVARDLAITRKRSANLMKEANYLSSHRSGLRQQPGRIMDRPESLNWLRHVSGNLQSPAQLDSSLITHHSSLKIGLHLSPHLVYIGERMQIFRTGTEGQGGKGTKDESLMPIGRFLKLFNEIGPVVEKIKKSKPDLTPSYFEILVAASFKYFADEKVDWAVVEVGLGGRLDATNVLKPELCVITNVGLDHTEILGETIEEIAREKTGIIKPGIPVVTGVLRLRSGSSTTGKALEVIEKVAKQKKAPLIKVNTQLGVKPLKSVVKDYLIIYKDIERCRDKPFASQNFLMAFAAVSALGFKPSKKAVLQVSRLVFPGRFEVIDKGVILDGAHNPDKIGFLIHQLDQHFNILRAKHKRSREVTSKNSSRQARTIHGVTLVVAFKKGKDWKKMLDLLVKNLPITNVIATKFYAVTDMGRYQAVEPKEIKSYLDTKYKILNTKYFNNSQEAVFEALNEHVILSRRRRISRSFANAQDDDKGLLILVTGSLYLVGEVRTLWYLPKFAST